MWNLDKPTASLSAAIWAVAWMAILLIVCSTENAQCAEIFNKLSSEECQNMRVGNNIKPAKKKCHLSTRGFVHCGTKWGWAIHKRWVLFHVIRKCLPSSHYHEVGYTEFMWQRKNPYVQWTKRRWESHDRIAQAFWKLKEWRLFEIIQCLNKVLTTVTSSICALW